jgi:hypothetical protein
VNVPVLDVLIVGGLQVPGMGGVFVEVPGSGGGMLLMHWSPIGEKVGVMREFTVTGMLLQTEVSQVVIQHAK